MNASGSPDDTKTASQRETLILLSLRQKLGLRAQREIDAILQALRSTVVERTGP